MATYNNIKKIKIGDNIFNLYDSGNSGGTITSVKTTAGTHSAINVTSGAASFNVPTKTSHLTNDSGFITASHTSTYSLPLAASGTRGGVQIGYSESGTNYAVKLSSEKMYVSVPWTDTKVTTAALTSGTTYYPILATGTGTATRQIDSTLTGLKYVSTAGTTSAVGTAILSLGNTTASGSANNEQGVLRLYSSGATYYTDIKSSSASSHKTITLPNATGTVALTSDIPSSTTSSTTGISISNHTTSNIGSASGWSAGSASTWAFEEVSIPNVTAAGSASTWTFEEKTIPNVTAAGSGSFTSGAFSGGSGSFSATVTSHVLSFSHTHTAATHGADSHTHTAPTIGTAIKVQSKSGGGNGTAPTIGTAIKVQSKKSGSNSTVPSLTVTSTAVVTGTSHTITDNGHTHALSTLS